MYGSKYMQCWLPRQIWPQQKNISKIQDCRHTCIVRWPFSVNRSDHNVFIMSSNVTGQARPGQARPMQIFCHTAENYP